MAGALRKVDGEGARPGGAAREGSRDRVRGVRDRIHGALPRTIGTGQVRLLHRIRNAWLLTDSALWASLSWRGSGIRVASSRMLAALATRSPHACDRSDAEVRYQTIQPSS